MPLAVGLAIAAAGVATFALRPREGQIEPAEVEVGAYFSDEELDRAEDFRGPQRVLALTNLAISGAALALIAIRPPRRVREVLARGRPYRTAAAAGAALSVALALVTLPIGAVMHERGRDVGLATQGWADWLWDVAKSDAIGAVFAAVGGVLYMKFLGSLAPTTFSFNPLIVITLVMFIVGGRSVSGVVAGATVVAFLDEVLKRIENNLDRAGIETIALAAIFTLMMIYRSEGLFGRWELDELAVKWWRRATRGRGATPDQGAATS